MDEQLLVPYYGKIANKLNEMIPIEWSRINLYVEDAGNSVSTHFYFFTEDGQSHFYSQIPSEFNVSQEIYMNLLLELQDICSNMRKEFVTAEEEPYYSFIFELDADWNFTIDFSYELDSETDDYQRIIQWQYDELGIVPDDGYGRSVLEDYLKTKEE